MLAPILATKLYKPSRRSGAVPRPHLIERLNGGLAADCRLTLISAPAGFGKTTLVGEWVAACGLPVAWLSLDEGDNDLTRFLSYLIVAMQSIAAGFGEGLLAMLQSPQPPSNDFLLSALLNEMNAIPGGFVFVLDDCHVIDAKPVNQALAFLVEHLPVQVHLVVTSREDPPLSLARLRARGQLSELRAADLRFSPSEATEFLNQAMGLSLSAEDIAALESRTEGWITGLQLAALALRGSAAGQPQTDAAGFIQSFRGSHRFVLDYLLEEVLHQQSAAVLSFLLRTSIFERLCGPLCEAVLGLPPSSGQTMLEFLEHANLFTFPLDDERRWYRYHHLFAELLQQRLMQGAVWPAGDVEKEAAELHMRASQWYEDNGLMVEAFRQAAAASDVPRAERLVEAGELPLHLRSVATLIIDWLATLPPAVLDTHPALWVRYASLSLINGRATGVDEIIRAGEVALQNAPPNEKTDDLIGQIATARATLAMTHYQADQVIGEAHCALAHLHPNNLPYRASAMWTMGVAYALKGERSAARQNYTETLALSQASGNTFTTILALASLGEMQELDNQLFAAAESYRLSLQLFGDHLQPNACEAQLGLGRIYYEWNDLDSAQQHAEESLRLAHLYDQTLDRFVPCEVFLARLSLARTDVTGALARLDRVEQTARRQGFERRLPEIAAIQVLASLRQGSLAAAAHLAQTYELPLCRARLLLLQGEAPAALAILEPLRWQMEIRGWQDEHLKALVLLALAQSAHGDKDRALEVLEQALALAEPGGLVRLFVDEGEPLAKLLSIAAERKMMPDYVARLLSAFEAEGQQKTDQPGRLPPTPAQTLCEPLSQREIEVLRLIAQGLSNREIGERLFLALDTIKGHNRRIFDKLGVKSRTEAIALALEMGIL